MPKASDNAFPSILLVEGTEPTAPAAGRQRLYVDSTTHLLKLTDSSGTDTTVGGGLTDPMTTRGDIIVRNASNVSARLGRGSASQVLTSDGTDVAWAAPGGGTYASWTPTLTADGGNPNIGSTGIATGRYAQIGKMVHAYGRIVFGGSGISNGSGIYEIALPVTAGSGTTASLTVFGSALLYDDSAGVFNVAVVYALDTGEFRIALNVAALIVQNGVPWTWAANDAMVFELTYEAA